MKNIEWLGNSKENLTKFPKAVVQEMGYALYLTQIGEHYHKTKPFKGCGSGVYEITTEYKKDAYRSIYIVNMADSIYVVHCFQKKSKTGIKTPKEHIEIIKKRIKLLKANLEKR